MNYTDVATIDKDKLLVGLKQVVRALEEDGLETVVLAEDSEDFIKGIVKEAMSRASAKMVKAPSKAELGRLCGIKVSAAVCGVLK